MSLNHENLGFGTNAVHVGQNPSKWEYGQIVPPISLSTTYQQPKPGQPIFSCYSRMGNPTREALEENLAAMEGGRFCKVFASGTAAIGAIASMFETGDNVIMNKDIYSGTVEYFRNVSVKQHKLKLTLVDFLDNNALKKALNKETKLVWFETPTNPLLKIVDIAEVVKTVKSYNPDIVIVVDNTFVTPYFQKPLKLGVDIVMHSMSKYINGHSDVIMGAAMTSSEDLDRQLHSAQCAIGAIPSPFDCYLANRGAKTLHLRMRAHAENGLAVAKFLEHHPKIEKVVYPGLESHPQYHVHKKQSTGMSGMVSIYLKGGVKQVEHFVANIKIIKLAESLGGVESTIQVPSLMSHGTLPDDEKAELGITDNLVRMTVGVEDKEDLLADLEQAFKSI
ncbi:Gamma-cystathionase [Aphelenchoides bicaudatus]|nr:Gamma-cystathionase [Aphelenchoides bicaudatus]